MHMARTDHIGVWITQGLKVPESTFKFWTPVYLHHTGSAITDLWRIQFWTQDMVCQRSLPTGPIPSEYRRIRLYHVRLKRCLLDEQTAVEQGLHAGDVLVLFSSDLGDLQMQLSMMLAQNWPPSIPVDLALTRDPIRLSEVPLPQRTDALADTLEAKVGFGGIKVDIKKLWGIVRARLLKTRS